MTDYHDHFDELAAQALTSETMIMRLIKHNTTILVSEIYAFDVFLNNEVNCSYIIMKHLQGRSLYKL